MQGVVSMLLCLRCGKVYDSEKLTKQYKVKGYKKNISFILFVDIY